MKCREQCSSGLVLKGSEVFHVLFQNLKEKEQSMSRGGHKAKELLSG